jgi:hypothetical protein
VRDLGVCASQLHGDVPRVHSADGEPEHEPHTVTDDSTVCVTYSESFFFTNVSTFSFAYDLSHAICS